MNKSYSNSSCQTLISEFPPPTPLELQRINWAQEKKNIIEKLKNLDDYATYKKLLEEMERKDFEIKEKELDSFMEEKLERIRCQTMEKFERRDILTKKRIEALKEKLMHAQSSN